MKLTIIGASGHGRVVAEIAELCGYGEIEFLDDDESLTSCGSRPVVGKAEMSRNVDNDVFIAIGNGNTRKRLMEELSWKNIPVLIHPSAVISSSAVIGSGTVVMAGAVVNPGAKVGRGCIVNTASSIDHDCSIGDFSHISVGTHLSGTVEVGDNVWIGAGATVSNNVKICSDVIIGAGAVVIHNIEEEGTYIGVPVKKMSKPKLIGGGGTAPPE